MFNWGDGLTFPQVHLCLRRGAWNRNRSEWKFRGGTDKADPVAGASFSVYWAL